jgi:uncharacterized protein (TIGR01777 family)
VKVALTGASGLLGTAVTADLGAAGHDVVRLVRRAPTGPDEARWDPDAGTADLSRLAGTHAVIHLAGAGMGSRPWTPAYKRAVWDSRVTGTRTLASALARLDPPPQVLLSASGVGYYGNPGDRVLDETCPAGDTFVARLARAWEEATAAAVAAGIRVVPMRTGVVLSARGGAFGRVLPLFRLGLGGRIGSGRQFWSWVSLADYVAAVRFLLARAELAGPVNVCSPEPVTNAELTATLARALHRPAVLPVPAAAVRLPLREFGDDLLRGQRVVPRRLMDAGFRFREPDLATAVQALVGGQRRRTS